MKPLKRRSNPENKIYFYTPSQTATELLYYPIVAGRYVSDQTYLVEREQYDSILALCVVDGSITLEQNGHVTVANPGELLLVDCYKPHKYYSPDHATTLWVHFDGANSRLWFSELTQKSQVFNTGIDAVNLIAAIIEGIKKGTDEYQLSHNIYSLLCLLSRADAPKQNETINACIADAKDYMQQNLEQDLTVAEIAAAVHFSAPYFSKIFKEATGFSPYSYLMNIRIEQAKKLLIQTAFPISLISCKAGFQSTENSI